jgi:serine O-acetyltransferase
MKKEKKKKIRQTAKSSRIYSLDPERMLEQIMEGEIETANNWPERRLANLLDKMVETYDKLGELRNLDEKDLPSKEAITRILTNVMAILFPSYFANPKLTQSNVRYFLGNVLHSLYTRLTDEVEKSLKYVCRRVKECPQDVCRRRAEIVTSEVLESLPKIRELIAGDTDAAYVGDPAAKSLAEIIISYPCIYATATYRVAHELYVRGVPMIPRIMTEHAHSLTGIDIHPGARIGRNFFIDHGTGVVIGETAEIGNNVRIYQGVTLGGQSFSKGQISKLRGKKRHPTIEDNVTIYAGATILGGNTIIGKDAVIGGNVWITSSIPDDTVVTIASPKLSYKTRSN